MERRPGHPDASLARFCALESCKNPTATRDVRLSYGASSHTSPVPVKPKENKSSRVMRALCETVTSCILPTAALQQSCTQWVDPDVFSLFSLFS